MNRGDRGFLYIDLKMMKENRYDFHLSSILDSKMKAS